jgi:hypothetical protein
MDLIDSLTRAALALSKLEGVVASLRELPGFRQSRPGCDSATPPHETSPSFPKNQLDFSLSAQIELVRCLKRRLSVLDAEQALLETHYARSSATRCLAGRCAALLCLQC